MADIFSVWGKPPSILVCALDKRLTVALKRYIEDVTGRAYSIGYDNGAVEGLCKVNRMATNELKAQRERRERMMRRRR